MARRSHRVVGGARAYEKVSVTLPADLLDEIRGKVGPGNLSRFLTEAAEEKQRHEALDEWLARMDSEHGRVLRGHPCDAAVHLLLKGCRVEPVSTAIGRAAGELLGRTGRKDPVDAVIVATAAELPAPVLVLTGDPSDLGALTADLPGIAVDAI